MTIDTTKLRELAQKATPGPWLLRLFSDNTVVSQDKRRGEYRELLLMARLPRERHVSNAAFIAAANPATVLALLDELEKRTLRADILEEMVTRAQHHVIFSRELDKGMLKRLLTAGSDKWVYSLRNELSDAVMEIDRLTDENVKLRAIEAAARNLAKVRHARITGDGSRGIAGPCAVGADGAGPVGGD